MKDQEKHQLKQKICYRCGKRFVYDKVIARSIQIPPNNYVICPNCGEEIPFQIVKLD